MFFNFLEKLESVLGVLNGYMWNSWLVWLLIGGGVYFTIRMGFPQILNFRKMWKVAFRKTESTEGISSWQALCTSAAGQVGTGTIVGVSTAIFSGGPGAIFWLWVTGLVGMGTIFAETIIAQVYKSKDADGTFRGGPAYYITKGLKQNWLAGVFTFCVLLAMPFVFNALHSNSISNAVKGGLGLQQTWVVGLALAVLTGAVVIGGIRRIARTAEIVVPFMAIAYIGVALIIVVMNIKQMPSIFGLIFGNAFGGKAIAGGVLGRTFMEAFRFGVARSLFANEAGMGTTSHAHATASVKHPVTQAYSAMIAVFINSFLICTASAAIIIVTGVFDSGLTGIQLIQSGTSVALGKVGPYFLILALFLFGWTSMISNYYVGESNIRRLFPNAGAGVMTTFRLCVLGMILFGSIANVPLVWQMADFTNAILATINVIVMFVMLKVAIKYYADYKAKSAQSGELDPTVDPALSKEFNVDDVWK